MRYCERKHRESSAERKLPSLSLFPVDNSKTCGGEMEEIIAPSGAVYGVRCKVCGNALTRCESCGKMFANLGAHLWNNVDDTPTECYAGNKLYRRMRAIAEKHS